MKDYYKILGVEEEASEEEIRARWIELTKYYHPDLRKTEEGDEKIKEINEAYEVLKEEPSRFQYDFERDLKRSFIKKAAHHRRERETSIRKIIMIPSGIVVLFLIVGFILLRSGRVAAPPVPIAETEALRETDKGSGKMTASRTSPVEIRSKAQSKGMASTDVKEGVISPESKKEAVPQESTKMASLLPPPSPSEVERESEKNKEPVSEVLPEPKVPARIEKEPSERGEPESKRELAPEVILKPEIPAAKEAPGEVAKQAPKPVAKEVAGEIPKQIVKEMPKEAPKEAPNQVVRETPKDIPREVAKEAPKEVAKGIPKEIPKEIPAEVPKETPKSVAKEIPKEVPREAPKQVAREVVKEVHRELPKEAPPREVAQKEVPPREIPKEIVKGPSKEVPKEVPREVAKGVPAEIPKQIAKEIPKEATKETPKQAAKEVAKEGPKEVSTATLHPGEHLTMWTKGGRVISSGTSPLAREEEVRQFFSNYTDRYHRKDVDGFLSLFSPRAIQNQTDRSEAIRNFYTKVFNQSQDLRYQIEGMKIDISQYRVVVKARFRVDQKLKKDGEEKFWKGNARWDLVKEEGRLKISSLDFQNDKSP